MPVPKPSRRFRLGVRVGVVVATITCLVVAADLVLTDGHSARGATVAGLDTGNRSPMQLTPVVAELGKRAVRPVTVRTPSGTAVIAPHDLGLSFDDEATTEALLRRSRNPVDRLLALFGRSHAVTPIVDVDRTRLDAALDERRTELERAAVEGGVHFDGSTPIADLPARGLRIDRDGAADVLAREWLEGDGPDPAPVDLPMEPFSPTVSADTVRATVAGPATAAVADDVTLLGSAGARSGLAPEDIGAVLTFVPGDRGTLIPRVDRDGLRERARRALARTERPATDARFTLAGGTPRVVGSRTGARIDWEKTAAALERVLGGPTGNSTRTLAVVYETLRPRLDTAKAQRLGVREVISDFTTGGFSSASGENIRLVAQEVDGALVLPGQTFSLNSYTGPRGSAQGYVASTIIDHGRPATAVGGGISQFATTLYNAAYFAGLEDVDHTEHGYYISRYPEAREATVFEGAIDLVFRNNTRHAILIETGWTPSSVSVRMWSTKTVEVQSITGERSAYTAPPSIRVQAGDDCIEASGTRGFTTSNTRVITDVASGREIYRHTRTVRYDPEPTVRCVA